MKEKIESAVNLIYNLDLPELDQMLRAWKEPGYRSIQIWKGIYQSLWTSAEQFSNVPNQLVNQLYQTYSFASLTPTNSLSSTDGETVKTRFSTGDSQGIEAVLMRYSKRRTLCISTQVGCAMGCTFCATGQMGFLRNLSSGEIVEQVLYYARYLTLTKQKVSNIVIMGMGEPLHNYEETFKAIDRLNHPEGFNFGARRFTVSTVGLVPAIRRLAAEQRQVNLAVSLHAADDDLRSSMLPINRKYSLDNLFEACKEYVFKTRRRITFEWALIDGVNDGIEQARLLAKRAAGLLCHVNVIPLNPTQKYAGKPSSRDKVMSFKRELENSGIPCTIRMRRGIEIQAGCGQLATEL